jgi:hypothetical protein
LKAGATLAQAGGRGIRVEDLGRGIAWQLVRGAALKRATRRRAFPYSPTSGRRSLTF